MLSDDLGEKKLLRKGLNFGMWALFCLRNIALKIFSLGSSFFLRINVQCMQQNWLFLAMCLSSRDC